MVGTGEVAPLPTGVRAALDAIRATMARNAWSFDRAFLFNKKRLMRLKPGDGCRSAWADMAEDYEAAYRILAKEPK